MAPKSATTINTHSKILAGSANASGGTETKITPASMYKISELTLESSITFFFGNRSTSDPRKMPEKATVMVYTPAMTDVAITDFVCRNTQKVTENHTNMLVIEAAREYAKIE
jgi:hypothetical protein